MKQQKASIMTIRSFAKSHQRGVSLIEAMVGLVILGAVVGMALWLKSVAWPWFQGWSEGSAVSTHMGKIESVYCGAANYTGLTTAAHANNTIFENRYLPGANVITNRFGGNVTLGMTTITNTNDTLQYTDTQVTSAACPSLVNTLVNDADRISVGGTIVKALNAAVVPATLNTQCNSAAAVTVLVERVKRCS